MITSALDGMMVTKKAEVYNNPQFGEIRTVTDESGEPWFCLTDICEALGLTAKGVKQRLDDEVISNYPITDTLGREQQALYVNEDAYTIQYLKAANRRQRYSGNG